MGFPAEVSHAASYAPASGVGVHGVGLGGWGLGFGVQVLGYRVQDLWFGV